MRIGIVAALLLAFPVLADEKSEIREIPLKDLKINPDKGAGTANPFIIVSADELAKSPILKDAADAIKKKVDFSKEKLVLFTWPGQAGAKVETKIITLNDKPTVSFRFTTGRIGEPSVHAMLFVIPKKLEVHSSTNKD
jgi:hypothetical protein